MLIYLQEARPNIVMLSCPTHQHILLTQLRLVDHNHCQVGVIVMDQSLVLSLNLYPIKSIADKDPHIIDQ